MMCLYNINNWTRNLGSEDLFSQSVAQAKATKKVEDYPPQTASFIYHELAERFLSPSTTALFVSLKFSLCLFVVRRKYCFFTEKYCWSSAAEQSLYTPFVHKSIFRIVLKLEFLKFN